MRSSNRELHSSEEEEKRKEWREILHYSIWFVNNDAMNVIWLIIMVIPFIYICMYVNKCK